jgi:hypothetical protein
MIGGEQYMHTLAPAAVIRRNVAVLGNALCENCAVPAQPTVIATYCPCFFESAEIFDRVLSGLANRPCFFPVNWPVVGVPNPSLLSDLNLSIPFDARCNVQAMPFIGEIIASCLPQ